METQRDRVRGKNNKRVSNIYFKKKKLIEKRNIL